jgi:hypothetical protein
MSVQQLLLGKEAGEGLKTLCEITISNMVHEPPILKKNACTTLIGASKDLATLTITW